MLHFLFLSCRFGIRRHEPTRRPVEKVLTPSSMASHQISPQVVHFPRRSKYLRHVPFLRHGQQRQRIEPRNILRVANRKARFGLLQAKNGKALEADNDCVFFAGFLILPLLYDWTRM